MVSFPTLPVDPGWTACTLALAVLFQGTTVSGEVCANTMPLVLTNRWPCGSSSPGSWQPRWGQTGFDSPFVYTTCPIAGASCTCLTPVVLKPCESDREMTLARTRIGALPG